MQVSYATANCLSVALNTLIYHGYIQVTGGTGYCRCRIISLESSLQHFQLAKRNIWWNRHI